ncbi:MAG TPA: energy transducer TonB [Candidatus Acidoferrum sp.]
MQFRRIAPFRVGIILVAALLLPLPMFADDSQFDALAARIAKEINSLSPRLVAVVDFRPPYGSNAPQGHFFSWMLSNALQEQKKKKFSVADHPRFDADLTKLGVKAAALVPGDSLNAAAPNIGADVLITGSIEKRGNSYLLQLTPVRVKDAKVLPAIDASIAANEFLDSMYEPMSSDVVSLSGKKRGEYTLPACVYCPNPSYSDPARKNRIQGVGMFSVLISPEGNPQQIQPLSLLGYGLDEQAYDALKKWKFKPVTAKDSGTAVPVIVPVEVSFRLY